MNPADLLASLSAHLPAFSGGDVMQVIRACLDDMTTLRLPENAFTALSRGATAGGLGAALLLVFRAGLQRRVDAKREAASRKIKERLGR